MNCSLKRGNLLADEEAMIMLPIAPVKVDLIRYPRSYQTDLFINRTREAEAIRKNVEQAQTGQSVTNPIVNFWGVSGSGKTWLLRHLQEYYNYRTGISALRPTFTLLHRFLDELAAASLEQITRTL